jgi:hypothetical protein
MSDQPEIVDTAAANGHTELVSEGGATSGASLEQLVTTEQYNELEERVAKLERLADALRKERAAAIKQALSQPGALDAFVQQLANGQG